MIVGSASAYAGCSSLLRAGQTLPQLFSDVRHERMQQAQRLFEHRQQTRARLGPLRRCFFGGDVCLGQFDVPVAEVVPEEVIQRLHRFVKLVTVERFAHVARGLVQSRKDPAIVQRQLRQLASNGSGSTAAPSEFIKQKRAAFQILLAKLRYDSTCFSFQRVSVLPT